MSLLFCYVIQIDKSKNSVNLLVNMAFFILLNTEKSYLTVTSYVKCLNEEITLEM